MDESQIVKLIKKQIFEKLSIEVEATGSGFSDKIRVNLLFDGEMVTSSDIYHTDIKYLAEF